MGKFLADCVDQCMYLVNAYGCAIWDDYDGGHRFFVIDDAG